MISLSFPLSVCWIIYIYYREKLHANHFWELKGQCRTVGEIAQSNLFRKGTKNDEGIDNVMYVFDYHTSRLSLKRKIVTASPLPQRVSLSSKVSTLDT